MEVCCCVLTSKLKTLSATFSLLTGFRVNSSAITSILASLLILSILRISFAALSAAISADITTTSTLPFRLFRKEMTCNRLIGFHFFLVAINLNSNTIRIMDENSLCRQTTTTFCSNFVLL
jgi:hypothetical protein